MRTKGELDITLLYLQKFQFPALLHSDVFSVAQINIERQY